MILLRYMAKSVRFVFSFVRIPLGKPTMFYRVRVAGNVRGSVGKKYKW